MKPATTAPGLTLTARGRAALATWVSAALLLGACGPAAVPLHPHPVPDGGGGGGGSPRALASDSAATTPPPAPALPSLAPPVLPTLPELRAGKVASGARYRLAKYDGPLAVISLRVAAGSLAAAPGVAELAAAAVLDGAASSQPRAALHARMAALGGELSSQVSAADTVLTLTLPASQVNRGATLLSGLLRAPKLARQHHGQLRDRAAARARVAASTLPDAFMLTAMHRLLLGHGDAAAAPAGGGTASELARVTANRSAAFYAHHYRAAAITLHLVGSDLDALEAVAKRTLAALPTNSTTAPPGSLPAASTKTPPAMSPKAPKPPAGSQPTASGKTPAHLAMSGHPLRVVVLDAPAAPQTRLLWASALTPSQWPWPHGALLAERTVEAAVSRGAASAAHFQRGEVLPWPHGGGVLTLWTQAPHDAVAAEAAALQQALRGLSRPPTPAAVSAMRTRVAFATARQLRSGPGTAHWLLQGSRGLAPQTDGELGRLLGATPQLLAAPGAEVLLAAGPAAVIAERLRGFGEVVVVDGARGFLRVKSYMPNFEIGHGEPGEGGVRR